MNTLTTAILWAIDIATLVGAAWAFIHCLRTRPDAFPAVGRQSKGLWLALTVAFEEQGFLEDDVTPLYELHAVLIGQMEAGAVKAHLEGSAVGLAPLARHDGKRRLAR